VFNEVCGEGGDVYEETVADWFAKLKYLYQLKLPTMEKNSGPSRFCCRHISPYYHKHMWLKIFLVLVVIQKTKHNRIQLM